MFQFSSKYSQRDPFPFLLEKNYKMGNFHDEILCFGVEKREGKIIIRPNGTKHSSGIPCQESEQSLGFNGALCSLLT